MKRVGGVLLATLLLFGLMAGPAGATEAEEGASEAPAENEPLPSISEVGQDNEVAERFFPEPYEQPTALPKLLIPLLAVGLLAAIVIFLLYLKWLPNWNRQRRERTRR